MREIAVVTALMLVVSGLAGGLAPGASAAQHQDRDQDQNDSQAGDGSNENRTAGGDGDNRTAGGGQDGGDRGPPESAQERRQQARDRAQKAGLFGQLTYQDGSADGKFVAFDLAESTAAVSAYTLTHNGTNTTVFDEVAPASFTEERPARVAGSQLRLMGDQIHLQAQDNPTGLLRYTSTGSATATFDLADDASTGEVRNGSLVNVKVGDRSGTVILAGNGTLTASDGSIEADLTDAGTVLFRAQPLGGSPDEDKQARALGQAMADGKLGASVRMAGANGTPASERTEFGVNVSPREATDGRARVELSADVPEGKVINLALDKGTLNVSTPDEAVVELDGDDVPTDASIDEVVNASDEAKAHVLVTNSTVEVTAFVPSFSVHSLVTKDSTSTPDLPTPDRVSNPTGATSSLAQQARQQATQRAQTWDQLPQQARDNAASQARDARLFGTFEVSGGAAAGDFVSAQVDASSGGISDVEASAEGATTVLEAVSFGSFTQATELQQAGPSVGLVGQDVTAILHDQPTAPLEVKAGSSSVTVTYELPDQASLERVDDNHAKVTVDGVHAHVLVASGNGELALEGDQIRLALGANAQSLFTVHPSQASAVAGDLHERLDAINEGIHGAQLAVGTAGDQAVDTAQSTSVQAQTKAVETGERVTATVESQVPDPRVVELAVPSEAVGATAAGDVTVQIDGQEVDQVGSSAELYSQAGSSTATAHVSEESGALQVLVNVPGFSSHDVTVQSTDDDGGGSGGGSGGTNDTGGGGGGGTDDAPGPGAVGLIAAAALGAALARVRRER